MTDELSCDYSLARPDPHAVRAAGYVAVWRYLDGGAVKDKSLTGTEAAGLHAAGLGIGLIWETTGTRVLDGAAAGRADGEAAAVQARKLGVPAGCPLLVNVGDFAATAAEIPAISDYYHAFRQVTGEWQGGGYATGFIIDSLHARGNVGLWWQNAMNDAGEPGSHVSQHASVYQRVTHTKTIAGLAAKDWDEDVSGFGPERPHWWVAAPPPHPPVVELEGILVSLPGGASRKVLSKDGGRSWQ